MNRWTNGVGIVLASASLLACSGEETSSSQPAPSRQDNTAWLLTSMPGESRSVSDAKASVAEGDRVVMRGRIGGRVQPISSNSSAFVIADMDLKHCGQTHDDACPTPWDYCCESPSAMQAGTATVQLVGADGLPLDTDPVAAGLSELDEVIVVGTVGPRPDEAVLTVLAEGVYRVGGEEG